MDKRIKRLAIAGFIIQVVYFLPLLGVPFDKVLHIWFLALMLLYHVIAVICAVYYMTGIKPFKGLNLLGAVCCLPLIFIAVLIGSTIYQSNSQPVEIPVENIHVYGKDGKEIHTDSILSAIKKDSILKAEVHE